MFSFFKKNNVRKEVNDMATVDEKDIKEAKKHIAEEGSDTQTERDREDESVAAQLKADGQEDSQTAKDRIDESEGTKKADEKEVKEGHNDHEERMNRMESKIDSLSSLIENINATIGKLMSARDEDERHLDRAKEKYGVGNSVFESEDAERNLTPAEAMAVVKSLKI